jgi:hypothetical protein
VSAAASATYQGAPCARGHSGRRFHSNRGCCECEALRMVKRRAGSVSHQRWEEAREEKRAAIAWNTIQAIYYEADFDAAGWRRV